MDNKTETSNIPERKPRKKLFESSDKIDLGQDGWLTPEGSFYPCKADEHDDSAKFLLSDESSEDLTTARKQAEEYLSPREILKREGYVLVRGRVLPTNDFIELTPSQQNALNEAGVQILDAIRSIEFSPEIAITTTELLRKRVDKIKNLEGYKEKTQDVKDGLKERGENQDIEIKPGLKQELQKKSATMAYSLSFGLTAIESIERFKKSPLTEKIYVDGHRQEEKEFVVGIFDILSENYQEGVSIRMRRWTYDLRVLGTDSEDIYALIETSEYRHDGLTGGLTGDENYTISVRLASKGRILERAKKVASDYNPDGTKREIILEGKKNIFSKEEILGKVN